MKKHFTIILILLLIVKVTYSQTKYEKEFTVKRSEVPTKALNFIDSCFSQKKVKWIKEIDLKAFSFEAKTKYLKEIFSIEFDTIGNIQDVELNIKLEDISENTKLQITQNIKNKFTKYKIKKIQIQWIGENNAIKELIKTKKTTLPHTTNYEIVIKANKALYELLFDSAGKLILSLEIIEPNNDNIEFL